MQASQNHAASVVPSSWFSQKSTPPVGTVLTYRQVVEQASDSEHGRTEEKKRYYREKKRLQGRKEITGKKRDYREEKRLQGRKESGTRIR